MNAQTKLCARCKEDLPLEMFGKHPRMASGLKSYCKPCCADYAREAYAKDRDRIRSVAREAAKRRYTPERGRARHLRDMYGLSMDEYRGMIADQGARCAICRTETPGGKSNTWHVDHCHDSSAVRELLCANCNVGIGLLAHDPERMRAAAEYVERHSARRIHELR